jgi:hypothetical protein
MSNDYNVFISWSGPRSRWVAEAFRNWLPVLVQAAKPWMSATDIEKGARGLNEVSSSLQGTKVAIVCLTPENLDAPWIHFEAGALSKTIDDKTRLCTYLLAGLKFQDVKPPLGMFQATTADKKDTRALVKTINAAVSDKPVPEAHLDVLFERMWPDLEEKLNKMPNPEQAAAPKRPVEDIVAELLEISRAQVNNTISMQDKLSNLETIANRGQYGPWAVSSLGGSDVLPGRFQTLSALMTAGQKVVHPFVFDSIPTFTQLDSTPGATESAVAKKSAAAKIYAGEAAPSKSRTEPDEKNRK